MTATQPNTGAGWYPDPSDPQRIRYWDGRTWTEHSLQAPPTQTSGWAPGRASSSRARPWWRRWWVVTIAVFAVLSIIGAMTNSHADSTKAPKSSPPASHSVKSKQTQSKAPTRPKVQRATVPLLKGMAVDQARQDLRSSHLLGGYIERRPSAAQPGTVLAQGLRSGKRVAWRSRVPLVVAVPFPSLPGTRGQSAAAAAQTLRAAGFRVLTLQHTVSSGTNGVVLSQSPIGGTRPRPHSLVTIVVAHVVRPVISAPVQTANCTPGYSPCLAPASDYDCAGGSGNGPKYVYGVERVTGADPYDLDADGDGLGCE